MPNQEKLSRAWVYARIPGDCAATRASYDACCRQAGDDGCTVIYASKDDEQHKEQCHDQVIALCIVRRCNALSIV